MSSKVVKKQKHCSLIEKSSNKLKRDGSTHSSFAKLNKSHLESSFNSKASKSKIKKGISGKKISRSKVILKNPNLLS